MTGWANLRPLGSRERNSWFAWLVADGGGHGGWGGGGWWGRGGGHTAGFSRTSLLPSKGPLNPYLTLPRQFMQLHDPSYTVPVHLMLYDFSADFPQILQLLHINPENFYFCALTNIFKTEINSKNFRAHRSIVEDTDLNSGPLFS